MDPKHIADLIITVSEMCAEGTLSLEFHGGLNRALWELAERKGIATEVSAIVQDVSLREMDEAIARTVQTSSPV